MLLSGAPTLGQHTCFDRFIDLLHFFIREKNFGFTHNVSAVTTIKDIRRHVSLEFTFAPEHDNGMYLGMLYSEEFSQGFGVPVVL